LDFVSILEKKPTELQSHFLQKPLSCSFEKFALESDHSNKYLHQKIGTSVNKSFKDEDFLPGGFLR
jgi:hypothetical protein